MIILTKQTIDLPDWLPDGSLLDHGNLLVLPGAWQKPAATEFAAAQAMVESQIASDCEYLAFPWATMIDSLERQTGVAFPLARCLYESRLRKDRSVSKRATVCQHIHAGKYIELFEAVGITDLFWSHATREERAIHDVRIHPFPLYPAQALERSDAGGDRKYLANFIGAYNPQIYLTDIREIIFRHAGQDDDLLIIARDQWHYERAVYGEQIHQQQRDEQQLRTERSREVEYKEAIRSSWFTLCPSGSGPNSIRIYESLCAGSIPIVFAESLRLAGPESLWRRAALFAPETSAGFAEIIETARRTSLEERAEMIRAGKQLYDLIRPESYDRLVVPCLSESGREPETEPENRGPGARSPVTDRAEPTQGDENGI